MALQFDLSSINSISTSMDTLSSKSLSSMVEDATKQKVSEYVGNYIPSSIQDTASKIGINNPLEKTSKSKDHKDPVDNYKVKLISATKLRQAAANDIERVIFDVSPTVTEERSVEYSQQSPIHLPGTIQVYKRTNSRNFSITADLISRTREDATKNIKTLQTLRGWTMPYFGYGSRTGSKQDLNDNRSGGELLGAPPDVLYLYAYSSPTSRNKKDFVNVNEVPVVITSLSISYPNDVDYIPTFGSNKEPMPTKMTVSISLVETHSPHEYESFSLQDFKAGRLRYF